MEHSLFLSFWKATRDMRSLSLPRDEDIFSWGAFIFPGMIASVIKPLGIVQFRPKRIPTFNTDFTKNILVTFGENIPDFLKHA